jgi:hypothetical protein
VRRLSGPKKQEVAEGCKKVNNEELHNLYSSPHIIRVIKLNRIRWTIYVICRRNDKCIQNFGRKKLKGRTIRET